MAFFASWAVTEPVEVPARAPLRWLQTNKAQKSEPDGSLFCASDETRTRTGIAAQGILSPSCLPFHHQGDDAKCKDKKNLRDIPAIFLLLLCDSLRG
jgi:hypothetical protein